MAAGSPHDFVQYGFTGGGVCDECHSAGEPSTTTTRLYRWATGSGDSAMCYLQCHSQSPSWPSATTFGTVQAGYADVKNVPFAEALPPPSPHGAPCGPQRCDTSCHGGASDYSDCLKCHAGALLSQPPLCPQDSAEYDNGRALIVGNFLSLRSAHNVTYVGSSGGDMTDPANNECLKCHGLAAVTLHPGGSDKTPIYVYPDDPDGVSGPLAAQNAVAWTVDTGPYKAGDPIYRWTTNAAGGPVPDYQLLQNFCLSCHDGVANSVAASLLQIGGRSVPPVPRRDPNLFDPKISQPPYFATSYGTPPADYLAGNYFEMNGHGRARSLEVSNTGPENMNLTCLAQNPQGLGPSWGCHVAHGSTNAYLIEDADVSNVSVGGITYLKLGKNVDTADELAVQVCMACHPRNRLSGAEAGSQDNSAYTAHGPYKKNYFHTWIKESSTDHKITHVSYADASHDTMGHGHLYRWYDNDVTKAWWPRNMEIGNTSLMLSNLTIPFFSSENAALDPAYADTRLYGAANLTVGATKTEGSVVTCVTCHDPHGTSYTYHDLDTDGESTKAMVRLPWSTMAYDDLFCGICHVDPNL